MGIGGGVVFGRQRRKALRFSGLHVWVSVVVWCLVGNGGRRCAFPAYMYGYRWWCGVWSATPEGAALFRPTCMGIGGGVFGGGSFTSLKIPCPKSKT